MPHSKPESKMERKDDLFVVNEVSLTLVNIYKYIYIYIVAVG
jgi:hypothetical protein